MLDASRVRRCRCFVGQWTGCFSKFLLLSLRGFLIHRWGVHFRPWVSPSTLNQAAWETVVFIMAIKHMTVLNDGIIIITAMTSKVLL